MAVGRLSARPLPIRIREPGPARLSRVSTHNGSLYTPDAYCLAVAFWRRFGLETPAYGLMHRVAFRLPGEDGAALIGPPDVLFFALFLATADRFGLRVRWTWAAMVGLLALTLVLTDVFEIAGLPALPAVAIGFLLPNADLLWRAVRERGLELRG